jgi:hypothetical protein
MSVRQKAGLAVWWIGQVVWLLSMALGCCILIAASLVAYHADMKLSASGGFIVMVVLAAGGISGSGLLLCDALHWVSRRLTAESSVAASG